MYGHLRGKAFVHNRGRFLLRLGFHGRRRARDRIAENKKPAEGPGSANGGIELCGGNDLVFLAEHDELVGNHLSDVLRITVFVFIGAV